MKKAILIIVLCFLWSNVGVAEQILLNCKVNESYLEAIAKSDRQRFSGKTISLTIDTEEKVIKNNDQESELILLHGIAEQAEFKEPKDDWLYYTTEIRLDDETIYKYKGSITPDWTGQKRDLRVEIDADRGAVKEMFLKGLKFKFWCG